MLVNVLLALAILLVVLAAFVATRPGDFRIVRTRAVAAPPERVHALINDFHNWPAWSPWEKMDTAMTRTYSGAPSGVGAVYAWSGNKKVGTGQMKITGAEPDSSLTIALDFVTPFESHNTTIFTLSPSGDSTTVTWTMSGPSPYLSKVMSVFVSMDRMVGPDFEAGLANLKTVVEH
jgi:uncharacterized protein YndB with AHSA1/START domain